MWSFQEEQEENPITDGDWTFSAKDIENVIEFLNKKHNVNFDIKNEDFSRSGFVDDGEIMSKFDIEEFELFEAFSNIIIDNEIYTCC